MKLSSVATAALAAVIVYLTGTLLFSATNRAAYVTLSAHLDRLEANVASLEQHRAELTARVELYRRSADAVELQARSLEYYEPGQEVIRTTDAPSRAIIETPGTILRRPPNAPDHAPYIRLAALIAFLVVLFLQILFEPRPFRGTAQSMRRASR